MSELSENLRSRIIDVLELVADGEVQRQLQAKVPCVGVPSALFHEWEDCYSGEPVVIAVLRESFDEDELDALRRYDLVASDVCASLPRELPSLDDFIDTPAWRRLWEAARATLRALDLRDRDGIPR